MTSKSIKINVVNFTNKTLEKQVMKKKIDAARTAAKELGEYLKKVDIEEVVKMIREDRDTR